jgi:hypothetical protein
LSTRKFLAATAITANATSKNISRQICLGIAAPHQSGYNN